MSGTGFLNPIDGRVYPNYLLTFGQDSPSLSFSLVITVTAPDLAGESADQDSLESALVAAAEGIEAVSGFSSTELQRIDATTTVLYNPDA